MRRDVIVSVGQKYVQYLEKADLLHPSIVT